MGLGIPNICSMSICKGNAKTVDVFEIKDENGNMTYKRNFITEFQEWWEYLGNTLKSYRNSDGKYIEYDNETGEPIEFTIPTTH